LKEAVQAKDSAEAIKAQAGRINANRRSIMKVLYKFIKIFSTKK
jgi:hypothetical protein